MGMVNETQLKFFSKNLPMSQVSPNLLSSSKLKSPTNDKDIGYSGSARKAQRLSRSKDHLEKHLGTSSQFSAQ
jgi:hypothetical protein